MEDLVSRVTDSQSLSKRRTEFRAAVDKDQKWRDEAREDYRFYFGEQWNESTAIKLKEMGRPVITDNRIKPLVNLLSGYQRVNRFESEFNPRTKGDIQLCSVRKGVTKYILDQCDYATEESSMFLDGIICGRAWLEVSLDIDYASLESEIVIRRVSPFDIYVDPESKKPDYSDARFMVRAKWVEKAELKIIYPEHADALEHMVSDYDEAERHEYVGTEPLWYQRDTKKLRLVEHWRKETIRQQYYLLANGDMVRKEDITQDHIVIGIKRPVELPAQKVIVSVFIDSIMLEEKDSPYEHGEFPFVPFTAYYLAEEDIPAGVVRDIKDLQRELNKRRSQSVNILNTQLNSGVIWEQGAIDANQQDKLMKIGTTPGVGLEVMSGGLSKIKFLTPAPPPTGEIQALQETAQAIKDVTGINESMLGSEIPSGTSGKAIELRQRQAITHIGGLFDNQRRTKLQVLQRMWGRKKRKGIIQQYYTEEKTFRIVGDDGKPDFLTVNQQVPVENEMGEVIYQTLNDLSVGEFDIVVSDTPATATQRISQFWALTDALSKLGIQGDMVLDILIDLLDIPQAEEIKKRWLERQQQMQQAQQAGQQNQEKISQSISFKDLPPDGQVQLAAKAGLQLNPQQYGLPGAGPQQPQQSILAQVIASLPPEILQQLVQIGQANPQQFAPALSQLFQQLPQEIIQQVGSELQGAPPEQVLQLIFNMVMQAAQQGQPPNQMQNVQQFQTNNRPQPRPMTQAAVREVTSGMQGGM